MFSSCDCSCKVRQWEVNASPPVHLLCDARSSPPRVAAVCFHGNSIEYADYEPSAEVLSQFKRRGDNQIASLELLAIAFGLSTFAKELRGGNIVVHSDNTVAENSVRKGRARSFDHTAVVHSIWAKILELDANMYVVRVASKENLADDPSRERYILLQRMAAELGVEVEAVDPVLDLRFAAAQSWDSLAVTAHRAWNVQKASANNVVVID